MLAACSQKKAEPFFWFHAAKLYLNQNRFYRLNMGRGNRVPRECFAIN